MIFNLKWKEFSLLLLIKKNIKLQLNYHSLKTMVSALTNDKVYWNKMMNIDLAKFMEDKPFVWDPKHPQYTNVAARNKAFAKFSEQYENMPWQAVKHRWTNLRSTYGFYMRKLLNSKAKGENYKVNWFLWEPCKYLYKVHKFAAQNFNRSAGPDIPNGNNTNSEAESVAEDITEKPNINVSCEDLVENIVTVFKGVQNDAFGGDTQYADVGREIAEKLSGLNSYEAAQLSRKIMEVLEEFDENNPTNPNNFPS